MAKKILKFNNIEYEIDDAMLAPATTNLQSHFLTVMNGEGATINLGEAAYNVDYIKLATATNAFVSHLETIAGSGTKVSVNGVEYLVDTAKIQDAIIELETTLGELNNPTPDSESVILLSYDNFILIDSNGIYITIKEDN